MKKSHIITIIVTIIVVLFASVFVFVRCTSTDKSNPGTNTNSASYDAAVQTFINSDQYKAISEEIHSAYGKNVFDINTSSQGEVLKISIVYKEDIPQNVESAAKSQVNTITEKKSKTFSGIADALKAKGVANPSVNVAVSKKDGTVLLERTFTHN